MFKEVTPGIVKSIDDANKQIAQNQSKSHATSLIYAAMLKQMEAVYKETD